MTPSIPVVVAGALGRMGAEVIKAVVGSADCTLVGAIDNTPGKEGSDCLLYTSPSPRDGLLSRMPSSA